MCICDARQPEVKENLCSRARKSRSLYEMCGYTRKERNIIAASGESRVNKCCIRCKEPDMLILF